MSSSAKMSVFVAQRKLKMFPTCLVPAACAQARTADGDALPKGGTYENSVERIKCCFGRFALSESCRVLDGVVKDL